jgi:CBS domain-containing protein
MEPSMKVKNAMHKGVTWVEPTTSVEQLARLMQKYDIGAIPIGENDRLVGMVTDRDVVCRCIAAGLHPKTTTARDVMTEGIIFCLDKQELDDAARIMETKKVRRLPVINGKKRMIGMLSLGDVCHRAPDHLSGEVMHAVSAHHD